MHTEIVRYFCIKPEEQLSNFFSYLRDKHALWYKSFLFVVCLLFIVWCLPKQGHFKYEFAQLKGKPWNYENLIAPFDFPIYKTTEEFNKERGEVIKNSKFYFVYNDDLLQKKINAFDTLKNLRDKSFYSIGKPILDSILKKGVFEQIDTLKGKRADFTILVRIKGLVEEHELGDYYSLSQADKYLINEVDKSTGKHKDSLITLLESCLVQSIFYNEELTQKTLNQDLNNLLPTRNKILKGQIIISKGEIVDDEKFNILSSLETEHAVHTVGTINYFLLVVGQLIIVALCLAMMFLFMAFFRKTIFAQNSHVTFLFLLISLFIFIGSRVYANENLNIYIVPFTIAPIIIRAFFDTRTALFAHLNIILLTSFFTSARFEFVLIETLAGVASIFSIANMTRRSQLLASAIIIFVIYALSYTGLTLILESKTQNLGLSDFTVFIASSLMVLIAYPMIFVFEKSFGFISDFTLLELSDSNTKLLRELASKAPGTFQHSLQVASLGEEAIQKIGGNPLLIRTGAMYHDIGKMENPRYFTENQVAGSNPHEDLSFEESATIIISHVIKGIEKARANRLPEQIIDFIRMHHGTSLTRYFYKKAIQEYGKDQVDENKYRYPGPIPFSKETAVLMMADSVEAASRSLKNYDAVSIDELVERIINSQIEEQQFINSDITFRDITSIKKIFKKRLMNIYHVRIEYPR